MAPWENKIKEKSEGYYGVKSEGPARVRLGAPDSSKGRIGREKTPTYILVKSPMSRRHLDLFHMTIYLSYGIPNYPQPSIYVPTNTRASVERESSIFQYIIPTIWDPLLNESPSNHKP